MHQIVQPCVDGVRASTQVATVRHARTPSFRKWRVRVAKQCWNPPCHVALLPPRVTIRVHDRKRAITRYAVISARVCFRVTIRVCTIRRCSSGASVALHCVCVLCLVHFLRFYLSGSYLVFF